MEKGIENLEALLEEARSLASRLSPREDRATVLTLSGELGAGKTAFVKALGKALRITQHITSPTFVLLKSYPLTGGKFSHLIHIDAYRLEGAKSAAPLRLPEYLRDAGNLVVVEWPERIASELPPADVAITLSLAEGERRVLSYG